ncbi:hypothetical protein, partial [Arenimonas caeni]|uniref:hypothetical protein n=1 Tax=Arenimonas caeni TaxID=2058085 RepID=UPI002A35B3E4
MYYLKRMFWLALAGACVLVMAFGIFRFAIEAGVSPLRYVVQDVAVIAAGLLGLLACRRQILRLAAGREAALAPTRRFKGHSLTVAGRFPAGPLPRADAVDRPADERETAAV